LALCAAVVGCGTSSKALVDKLVGSWTVVEASEKGKPLSAGARFKGGMTFDREHYEQSIFVEGGSAPRAYPVLKGRYSVNAAETPAHIDFIPAEGEDPSALRQGIFEFDGPKLKICVGGPGQSRPASLIGLSEGEMLIVLEQKK